MAVHSTFVGNVTQKQRRRTEGKCAMLQTAGEPVLRAMQNGKRPSPAETCVKGGRPAARLSAPLRITREKVAARDLLVDDRFAPASYLEYPFHGLGAKCVRNRDQKNWIRRSFFLQRLYNAHGHADGNVRRSLRN